MAIKFIEVKNYSHILDQYHCLIWKYTGTITIALCNTVENLYLIIVYIFVALNWQKNSQYMMHNFNIVEKIADT